MYDAFYKKIINKYPVYTINKKGKFEELVIWFSCGSMNEKKEEKGYIHMLEHLLMSLEINDVSFKSFLCDNSISMSERSFFDSMYIYFKARNDIIMQNLNKIFEFLFRGLVSSIDVMREKKIIHEERTIRKVDILSLNDEYYQYFWKDGVGNSILGTNETLKNFNPKCFRSLLNEIMSPDYMSLYYCGGNTQDFRTCIASIRNKYKIESKLKKLEQISDLNEFFSNSNIELPKHGEGGKRAVVLYAMGKYRDRKTALMLSLLSLSLAAGKNGYLVDKFRYETENLYHIVAKPYFLFNCAYLEITMYYTVVDFTDIVSSIKEVFSSQEFFNYIDSNIKYIKRDMMDYIELKTGRGDLMKDFLLFLAKENQINAADDLCIVNISNIINNISQKDMFTYIRENIRDNCCSLILG